MNEMVTKSGFEFSSMGIATVLKKRLLVPPYQREYSWEEDQVRQLFSDISSARSENRDYFLGTIVTISHDPNAPLEIVDGQQRLTTTTLLLVAIRNHLEQLNIGKSRVLVEAINNDFLSTIDRSAGERVPRLTLNIDDNEFFKLLINDGPNSLNLRTTRQSHELLIDAANAAKDWVSNIAKTFATTDVPDRLNDWVTFIEHNANVILLQAPNGAQAFKMFETLNDRGLRTSQADLVKSYLFGQSGDRISEALAKWSSMRDNLEELDDDDRAINFLRHSLIATRSFARADEVYDITQNEIRGTSNSVEFLAELERISKVYVATFRSDAEFWAGSDIKTRNALRTFNRFDIKPMRPLLLSVALKFKGLERSRAIQLLMAVSVRLVVASATRSGTNEQTFASAALEIYNENIKNAEELKTGIARVIVSDAEFRESFATARSSKPDLARYYLRALEAQNAAQSEPWYVPNEDTTVITLEHVLPKNPNDASWQNFDDEARLRYTRRIGNLCLLQKSTNSSKGNDEFGKVKQIYEKSPYALTKQISEYTDWTPQTIEDRQEKLADLAVDTWPI